MDDYNKIFEEALGRLNAEQLEAVETIEGAVAVVAGPGTGKTQILALRIGNILRKTQVSPLNILALTFTESGVLAMKERLVKLIGPTGYDVQVFTFHSFCLEVMDEFPELFAKKKALKPIDDIKQYDIIREIIENGEFEFLSNAAMGFSNVKTILGNLNSLKQENTMPKDVREYLENALEEYATERPGEGSTKKALNDYKKKGQQLDKLKDFVVVYERYEEYLKENSFCDFADMILFVVAELEANEDLRLFYQERYQYILADEFQDSNNSQARIVELLSSYFEEDPNLFVVGDDDQSIYRFQGASVENFANFFLKYPSAKKIVLKQNYRSTQLILDAGSSVIKNNTIRIEPNKKLESNFVVQETVIEERVFGAEIEELNFLGTEIKKLIELGVKHEEIAVITRNNQEIINIAKYFDKLQLPYSLSAGSNILDNSYVKLVIALLRVLNDPTDLHEFRKVLFLPNLEIPVKEIMLLNWIGVPNDIESVFSLDSYKEGTIPAIKSLVEKMSEWFKMLNLEPLPEALIQIMEELGLIKYLGLSLERLEDFEALNSFMDYVKMFYLNNDENKRDLKAFVASLDAIEEHSLKIKEKAFLTAKDSVQLMTAHKSKGLEFEYVFIPNATFDKWNKIRRRDVNVIPTDLVVKNYENELQVEEEARRLFYVALTRAKKYISISYAKFYDGSSKESLISKFATEIEQNLVSKVETESLTQKELVEVLTLHSSDTHFREKEINMIKELVTRFELSATALQDFLRCNRTFFMRHILKIPSRQNYYMVLGIVIHELMEKYLRRDVRGLSEEEILSVVDFRLGKMIVSDKTIESIRKESLDLFVGWKEGVDPDDITMNILFQEKMLKSVFEGIPLKGKIDMVETLRDEPGEKKEVRVIDFKVKVPCSLNSLKGGDAKQDPSMYHQLMFYKLLLEAEPNNKVDVTQGAIAFVKPNSSGYIKTVSLGYDEQDLTEFKNLIKDSYQRIQNLEFLDFAAPCECEECEYKYIDF